MASAPKRPKAAADAKTAAIRDSVEIIGGLEVLPVVDRDEIVSACEDAGCDMPD